MKSRLLFCTVILLAGASSVFALTQKTIGPTGRDFTTFQQATAWLRSQPQPLSDDYEFLVDSAVYAGTCTLNVNNSSLKRVWFHAAVSGSRPELKGNEGSAPYGALLTATPRTVLDEIIFSNNTSQNPSYAVLVSSAAACTLTGCTFSGGGSANWLDLRNAPDALVRDCEFINAEVIYSAVLVEGSSSGARIHRSGFLGAAGPGWGTIYIGSPHVTVDTCLIAPANNNPGIVSAGTCSDAVIRGCEITETSTCVNLATADRALIDGCVLAPAEGGSAVTLNSCPDVVIRSCTTAANPVGAIGVATNTGACDRLKIDSVTFLSHARTAIDIGAASSGSRISGCIFEGSPTINAGAAISLGNGCVDDSIIGCRITQRSGYSYYSVIRVGSSGPGSPVRRTVIANNFVLGHSSPAEGVINLAKSDQALIAYNTVVADSDLCPACILAANATNLSLVDNVIWNRASTSGNFYCYKIASGSSISRTDYNDLYLSNGGNRIVRYIAVDYLDLAAWQAASIRPDSHSISRNPLVRSLAMPFDLHLQDSSPCIGRGTPVPGILTDIDGDIRDVANPDIGADEDINVGLAQERTEPNPACLALQVAPNPFSNATTITYSLSRAGSVSLKLYDISGKLVTTLASGSQNAGFYEIAFRNQNSAFRIAKGIHVLKFETDGYSTTRKLTLE